MDLYSLTLVLYLFLIYWLIVVALDRKGILERFNISAFGPVLMIRTRRGERLLERLAKGARKERFWRIYANIGTILVLIAMTFMFILVVRSVYAMALMPPEPTEIHEPRNWLLIPGLNEFIPMLAWIGFVIALVVHELSHAVLSTVEKIKVKSMGLLVVLIPIGAFAEPDSEQLFGEKRKEGGKKRGEAREAAETEIRGKKVATSRERTRILSAGVTSNFFVALLAFLFFFAILFSVQPLDGTMLFVHKVLEGSPAEKFVIESGMVITGINGSKITSESVERMNDALSERKEIVFTVLDKNGKEREILIEGGYESVGLIIGGVVDGSPADKAGLKEGMSIIRMDTEKIDDSVDFQNFMNQTVPGQLVEVETRGGNFIVELGQVDRDEKGYLGVFFNPYDSLGMIVVDSKVYLKSLQALPSFFVSLSPLRWLYGWILLTIMPIDPPPSGFGGFNPLLIHLYEPVGVASFFGGGIFWIADVLFWVGWINFYVGLFNCLPAVPLDGGYVFKEMLNPVLRGIKEEKRKEKIVKAIVSLIAMVIFSSIMFMLIGPYLL
ncbi:MAG: site-2 protease family protein [Methanophagales archaeon]|nr:site-2 protease family protein [Methanophagales archaeon]